MSGEFGKEGGNQNGKNKGHCHRQSERRRRKTVSTVTLGVGFARAGERVLLVDADPQASLTVSLGIRAPDDLGVTVATVMQSVIDERPPPRGYGIIHHDEGIDLLPANIELSAFEVGLTNVMSREYVLREALEPLRERYDRILRITMFYP